MAGKFLVVRCHLSMPLCELLTVESIYALKWQKMTMGKKFLSQACSSRGTPQVLLRFRQAVLDAGFTQLFMVSLSVPASRALPRAHFH